ncbi:NAD(P)-dependent oxidoreductase [bacterium]|nr:NAD(P)-dependent oxidoreductase [bacterium]
MADAPPRLAVIGGSGLLGSHLVAALDGWTATSLDPVPFPSGLARPEGFLEVVGDAFDESALASALEGAEAVWIKAAKLAGDRHDDSALPAYRRQNVDLVATVLAAAGKAGIRRAFLDSSDAVFLESWRPGRHLPYSPPCPKDHYGRTKAEAEALLREWALADNKRSGQIFRYSRVRDSASGGVLALWCAQAELGLPIKLFGDGTRAGCVIHLTDCVAANLAGLAQTPRFAIHNVTLPPVSLQELADLVAAEFGGVSTTHVPDTFSHPDDPRVHAMDAGDTWDRLGVSPQRTVAEMVAEAATATRGRLDSLLPAWLRPFRRAPVIAGLVRISLVAALRRRGVPL